ncbi:MAG: FG-GAP-like repeat-containing protein [Sulfuritalea sp.]|nr:FG-GAP-like repeat-containing protein [Sulfuritalea sp.]
MVAPALDLVIANWYGNNIGVLANDGIGGFAAAVALASGGSNPSAVALGDMNGDGRIDIVTTNYSSGLVSLLAGDGAGSFAAATSFATGGSNPHGVALGDVNGDGKIDIVVANRTNDNIGVLLGDGAGSFATAVNFASGGANPYSVALGDVTGDGKLDIVTPNFGSNNVGVLAGDGAGAFGAAATFASGGVYPSHAVLGDVNGDGKLDIVTSNAYENSVAVLVSDGAGGFQPAVTFASGGLSSNDANRLLLADVNGDSTLDILVANVYSSNVGVLTGDGAGGFAPAITFSSGGSGPTIVTGDVNGDGILDIVTANFWGENVGVLLGDGAGGFAPPLTLVSGGSGPGAVALGDIHQLHYIENLTATPINTALLISDIDSVTLNGATVTITDNFHATEDILGFSNTANIVGSYDAAGGVLTLSGADTLAAYQAALRAVTYFNASDNPSTDPRTISYAVDDGAAANHASNSATVTLAVTPVNDAPTANAPASFTVTEEVEGNLLYTGTPFADVDSSALTVTLSIDDGTITGNAGTGVTVGGTASARTFSGTPVALDNYFTTAGSITYQTAPDNTTARTLTTSISDGSLSSSASSSVTIIAVNDAPSFTKGSDLTVLEDAGAQTVTNWATAFSPGPANESGQTFSFNVTGNTNPGMFAVAPAVSANGTLTYTLAADVNGTSAITLALTDSGGTANGGVDTSTAQSFNISATAVNDAPTLSIPAGSPTLDIVTANWSGGSVSVLADDGAGGLAAATTFNSGGSSPLTLALGDVNGDGKLDIVTANRDAYNIGVLVGDGVGGFPTTVTFASSYPRDVALGDVNGDGKLDIVALNWSDFGVLTGDGAGGFETPVTFGGGSTIQHLVLGDVTGDGKLDIVAADRGSNSISVLAGDGAGNFAGEVSFASGGTNPYYLALGDMNGDGKLDVVTANSGDNTVGVLLGDGTGGFAAAATFASGGDSAMGVSLGDVNGDGKLDIVVANIYSNNVGVLVGDGAGGFAAVVTLASGGWSPQTVALGDVTGDGKLDIVAAHFNSHDVGILAGDGAGGFATAVIFASGGSYPGWVALGDLNGDGSTQYTESQAATPINAALLIADIDSATLAGATVSITGNFHATEDVLGFSNTVNIVGSYDAADGVLTLSGTDTLAAYQAALRAVTYFNSSDNPSTDARTISYAVDDGAAIDHASNIVTAVLLVTPTNVAPVAVADTESGNEDTLITGSVASNDSDVDSGAVLSYALNGTMPAGLSFNNDGSYSFDAGNAAYQQLAQGVTTDVVANYAITDEHNASASSTLTISLTGANDTPVLATPIADQSTAAHFLFSHALATGGFSDADSGDSLSLSARLGDGNALPAWLHFDSASGSFSGTPTYQNLGNLDIAVTATDSGGASVTDTFTLVVNTLPAITGTATNDVLIGTSNPDTLDSGDGNDILIGGKGPDLMLGGPGDDVYVVDHRFDQITELADSGFDSVSAKVGHVLADNVENLFLTGSITVRSGGFFSRKTTTFDLNSDGTGNASDNLLRGNRGHNELDGLGGNDTLLGGAGADILIGGTGADRLVGGAGTDSFVIAAGDGGSTLAAADVLYDFEDGIDQIGLTGGLTFDNLTFSQGNGTDTATSNTVIGTSSGEYLVVLLHTSTSAITALDFQMLGM